MSFANSFRLFLASLIRDILRGPGDPGQPTIRSVGELDMAQLKSIDFPDYVGVNPSDVKEGRAEINFTVLGVNRQLTATLTRGVPGGLSVESLPCDTGTAINGRSWWLDGAGNPSDHPAEWSFAVDDTTPPSDPAMPTFRNSGEVDDADVVLPPGTIDV